MNTSNTFSVELCKYTRLLTALSKGKKGEAEVGENLKALLIAAVEENKKKAFTNSLPFLNRNSTSAFGVNNGMEGVVVDNECFAFMYILLSSLTLNKKMFRMPHSSLPQHIQVLLSKQEKGDYAGFHREVEKLVTCILLQATVKIPHIASDSSFLAMTRGSLNAAAPPLASSSLIRRLPQDFCADFLMIKEGRAIIRVEILQEWLLCVEERFSHYRAEMTGSHSAEKQPLWLEINYLENFLSTLSVQFQALLLLLFFTKGIQRESYTARLFKLTEYMQYHMNYCIGDQPFPSVPETVPYPLASLKPAAPPEAGRIIKTLKRRPPAVTASSEPLLTEKESTGFISASTPSVKPMNRKEGDPVRSVQNVGSRAQPSDETDFKKADSEGNALFLVQKRVSFNYSPLYFKVSAIYHSSSVHYDPRSSTPLCK